jgi:hypothetical protein
MNLTNLRQWPYVVIVIHCDNGLFEQLAIALDVLLGVVRRQSEVERFAGVAARNTPLPGAETMHQPWNVSECVGP